MRQFFLSLGSNIDKEKNIVSGVNALIDIFPDMSISSTYESKSVGFSGNNFFNLVSAITTNHSVGEIASLLRKIEEDHGRDRTQVKFSSRTLDIDILTCDDLVGVVDGILLPRGEITEYAFVLEPLAELAPNAKHPVLHLDYQTLWQRFDKSEQKIWRTEFQAA